MGKDRQRKKKQEGKKGQKADGDKSGKLTDRRRRNKDDGVQESGRGPPLSLPEFQEQQELGELQEEEKEMDGQRRYSRRKIVSNWTRYEEPSDDEEEAVRAASAMSRMKLEMAVSVQSQAQFSFQREASWDAAADKQDVTSSLVSVECEKLAISLQSIPASERLCLDKRWFDPATLEAIESKSLPSKPDERMRPIPPLPKEYELEYVRQYFGDKQTLKKADENWPISPKQKTAVPKQQETTKEAKMKSIQTEESSEHQQSTSVVETTESTSLSDHSKEINNESNNCEKTTQKVNDSLNILEADVKEATTNQTSTNQTQELEDWLESVLD